MSGTAGIPAPSGRGGRQNRTVAPGARARLRSTVDLLRSLAVTGGGGLEAARQQRLETILAAEQLGDTELTARVIGAYDVPAIWTHSDEPGQAAQVVAAAERTLAMLPPDAKDATRARLLATIAIESRGDTGSRGRSAAMQAEDIARHLEDPALLAFALNGVFMQTFYRTGLAEQRDAIGTELITLSSRHGLVTYELLGRLIRLQARCAFGDLAGADEHANAADVLATSYESPLVAVFTGWYRALRLAMTDRPPAEVAAAYRAAAAGLEGCGMLAGWGRYEPWIRPLVLLTQNRRDEALAVLGTVPDPPNDHLLETLWCFVAQAALALGDRDSMQRAYRAYLRELAEALNTLAGLSRMKG